ncbi:MAG: GDSL-type esterase/lipase family protein [Bacillota bacterium]|nr:GDSL-type esterase/lipase family protein [Bacillota bacterium]
MRNKRLGLILILFIVLLVVIAVLVTKAFTPSGDDESDSSSFMGGIFSSGSDEPEETEPPEPTPTFTTAPEGYFNDALIIGDSRTEGMRMCADIPGATYFCSVGMGVTGAFYEAVSIDGLGTYTLDSLLAAKQFGKVYIMLGINDIGGDIDTLASRFGNLVDKIRTAQPDAIIVIEANLRVTAGYNSTMVTNERIDRFNELISHYADNETIFYLDVNPLFDDGTGKGLNPSISPDGLHVPGAQYVEWANWIMNHAVVFQ